MNTHELADTLKAKDPAEIYLFGGYQGDQTILIPFRIEYSKEGDKAVVVPDLPTQAEEDIEDLVSASKAQGNTVVNEQTVQACFTDFELERVKKLKEEWDKEEDPNKPQLAPLFFEEIVTEEKIQEINQVTGQENDRKFWAYVLEAYVLNVLEKSDERT